MTPKRRKPLYASLDRRCPRDQAAVFDHAAMFAIENRGLRTFCRV